MISWIELILLSAALAIDCFSVSIATGIAARRPIWRPMAWMALCFGIFQGGMTWLGYIGISLVSSFFQQYDLWIAFVLLLYLGIRMILEGLHPDEQQPDTCTALTPRNIVTLSVATSIDALAVGLSFGCMDDGALPYGILPAIAIIGLMSTLFSVAGLTMGIMAGRVVRFRAELLGGAVLIAIGLKILIEHLA